MKLLLLATLTLPLAAVDAGIDALAFGASHHSNREYPWREFNPGAGVSAFAALSPAVEVFAVGGAYRNSINANTVLAMIGWRYSVDAGPLRAGVSVAGGVLTGYDGPPTGILASGHVGYGRCFLEFGYRPTSDGKDYPATAVVAGWLRFRVAEF